MNLIILNHRPAGSVVLYFVGVNVYRILVRTFSLIDHVVADLSEDQFPLQVMPVPVPMPM